MPFIRPKNTPIRQSQLSNKKKKTKNSGKRRKNELKASSADLLVLFDASILVFSASLKVRFVEEVGEEHEVGEAQTERGVQGEHWSVALVLE